jgi:hypothetical protein
MLFNLLAERLIMFQIPQRSLKKNATITILRALKEAHSSLKMEGILLPSGTYHFYTEKIFRKYCFLSNNDEGIKKIAFYLNSLRNFKIIGDNTKLIFHGRIIPFLFQKCQNIVISNIEIDFHCDFVSNAEIINCGKDYTDIVFERPIAVKEHKLVFPVDDDEWTPTERMVVVKFDRERREPSADNFLLVCSRDAEYLDLRTVRLPLAFGRPGDLFAVKHQARHNPAIVLDNCSGISIDRVTICHSGAMGILAQFCNDITLKEVKVTPSKRYRRLVSCSDDAAHFVDCRGEIIIKKCLFENQLDDAVNIHGIYRRTSNLSYCEKNTVFLENAHCQQLGTICGVPGDTLEFIKNDTLKPYGRAKIKKAFYLGKQLIQVLIDRELPTEFMPGDCVWNISAVPTVKIVDSVFRNNRPRGILLSGVRNALVENNLFHTVAAAIYVSGDTNLWFESGPAENVRITGNTFENCYYINKTSTRSVIDINPVIHRVIDDFYYHHNFTINNNKFISSHDRLIRADAVDGMAIYGNTWIRNDIYDNCFAEEKPVTVNHCTNLKLPKYGEI